MHIKQAGQMSCIQKKTHPVGWSLPSGDPWLCTHPPSSHSFVLLLAASHLFPYVKKRIQVISQWSTELNPIEVAIDEMSKKVSELNQLCTMEEVDMIRLQLKLQGSVSVKVSFAQIWDACGPYNTPWHLFFHKGYKRSFYVCDTIQHIYLSF